MSGRALIAIACVLFAAFVWIWLNHPSGAQAPLAAPTRDAVTSSPETKPLDTQTTSATEPATGRDASQAAATTTRSSSNTGPSAIVLFGHVTDLADADPGTRDGWVSLTDFLGTRIHAEFGDDGNYSISGLQTGHYWFSAGSHSGGEKKATLDLTFAENPKRFDVTLEATPALLVKASDKNGQRVRQLLAVATLTPPGDWFTEVSGSMNNPFGVGRFHWNGDPSTKLPEEYFGRLSLDVPPPVYVSLVNYHRVIATQHVEAGQKEVAFVVDTDSPLMKPGSLRVRFVRPDCTCITDANAMLAGASGVRSMKREGEFLTATGLAPGLYQIDPHGKGLDRSPIDVRIEPGVEKELVNVTREPEVWISGRIRWSEQLRGRLSMRCDLFYPEGEPAFHAGSVEVHDAEPDGTFRIGGLGHGLYLIKLGEREGSFGMCARIVDTRGGPIENVQLEIVPAVPLVVRASNDDWAMVRYKVIDKDGAVVVSTRLWSPEPSKLSLAPGAYDLEVTTNGSEPQLKHISIGSKPVELALP